MLEKAHNDQIEVNELLWKRWTEHGIKSNDNFEIEFHFIATKTKLKNIFVSEMKKIGFSIKERETVRKLLIFKKWLLTISIYKSWTLESLNEQTLQFCRLADRLGVDFDGCGAYMPQDKNQ